MNRVIRIIAGFCFLISLESNAQQLGQYSQYMMNYYLLNPAASGMDDYIDLKVGYRNQWTGLAGAPQNYYVTANSPLSKIHSRHDKKFNNKMALAHHAIGGIVSGQTLGAISNNSAYFTYDYHLPLNKSWNMSCAASAGLIQSSLNTGKVEFSDNLPDVAASGYTTTKPDMTLGIWFYSKQFFGGISSVQLFDSKLGNLGKLNRQYNLTAGYKFKINREWNFIPSFLFKTVPNSAYQVDLNAKAKYLNIAWGGISYRNKDALVLLAGVTIKNFVDFGYSYDLVTSSISKVAGGSHEIMLGFRLNTQAQIVSPNDFW